MWENGKDQQFSKSLWGERQSKGMKKIRNECVKLIIRRGPVTSPMGLAKVCFSDVRKCKNAKEFYQGVLKFSDISNFLLGLRRSDFHVQLGQ